MAWWPEAPFCPWCGDGFTTLKLCEEHMYTCEMRPTQDAVELGKLVEAMKADTDLKRSYYGRKFGWEEDAGETAASGAFINPLIDQMLKPYLEGTKGHSPILPEEAVKIATALTGTIAGGVLLWEAATVAAEAASLGQIETQQHMIKDVLTVTGLFALGATLLRIPLDQAVLIPTRQFYASVFTPEIPGSGDLVRFLVREVITTDVFQKMMKYQGFSAEKAGWYWDAHWVLPARGELVDALHRGVISQAEYNKFIVWHDYSPTARPGIAKSDLEILSGIRKRLIPRVDLRRGWDLGEITDAGLTEGYVALGYEDDAPLMARIQKAVALAAERSAYARALLRAYRKGQKTAEEVRKDLTAKRFKPEAINLMLATEDLQRTAGAGEPLEEPRTLTASQILRAYRLGAMVTAAARTRLTAMGYEAADADLLLAMNRPHIEEEPRYLTASQVLSAYRHAVFTEEIARGKLKAWGYTAEDVDVLLLLNAPEKPAEPKFAKHSKTDIRYAWLAGLPGFETMAPHFQAINYTLEASGIQAAIARSRALSGDISDLEREVELRHRSGFITDEQAAVDLEALGFHPLRIQARIELYKTRRQREHMEAQLDSIEEAYLRDLVTWQAVEATAQRLIMVPEVREEYLDRVYFRKIRTVRVAA